PATKQKKSDYDKIAFVTLGCSMLTVHALDRSAEERVKIVHWLYSLLREEVPGAEFVPRVDVRPVAPEELKFNGTPDICFIGPALLEDDLSHLARARKVLPTTPLIACTRGKLESLPVIEQLARLG